MIVRSLNTVDEDEALPVLPHKGAGSDRKSRPAPTRCLPKVKSGERLNIDTEVRYLSKIHASAFDPLYPAPGGWCIAEESRTEPRCTVHR